MVAYAADTIARVPRAEHVDEPPRTIEEVQAELDATRARLAEVEGELGEALGELRVAEGELLRLLAARNVERSRSQRWRVVRGIRRVVMRPLAVLRRDR